MTVATNGGPTHEAIRADVLRGEWAPGARLQPVQLAKVYSTSTTVVREALTRLAGENFVILQPNKGFFVPSLSLAELKDVTEARCVVEELALRFAIERGDVRWESELIATHHQLTRVPRRPHDDTAHVSEDWAIAHRRFHAKLLEASSVPHLTSFADQLASATALYVRWAAPHRDASERDVEKEHEEILAAVLDRDAETAVSLLRRHYERTAEIIEHSSLAAD